MLNYDELVTNGKKKKKKLYWFFYIIFTCQKEKTFRPETINKSLFFSKCLIDDPRKKRFLIFFFFFLFFFLDNQSFFFIVIVAANNECPLNVMNLKFGRFLENIKVSLLFCFVLTTIKCYEIYCTALCFYYFCLAVKSTLIYKCNGLSFSKNKPKPLCWGYQFPFQRQGCILDIN